MKLEEMKESQKEIKWEHDDDVSSCRKCEKPLDVPQDKVKIILTKIMYWCSVVV
jgi:hypothetical protein